MWVGDDRFQSLLCLRHDDRIELLSFLVNQICFADQCPSSQVGTNRAPFGGAVLGDGVEVGDRCVEIPGLEVRCSDLISAIGKQLRVGGIRNHMNVAPAQP